ncbi:MAG: hypothetical protein ACTSV2_06230 [Candidatus Thorarchaeota archaeon]
MSLADTITYLDKHSIYQEGGEVPKMGAAKKLILLLLIYFIAGFVIFYLISTGTAIPMWDTIGEIMNIVFLPVGWVFNLLAPTLGLSPVPVAYALPI